MSHLVRRSVFTRSFHTSLCLISTAQCVHKKLPQFFVSYLHSTKSHSDFFVCAICRAKIEREAFALPNLRRKVLPTSHAVKKTFRVRIRIRAQSKCCKNNHAWHKKKSCKQNTFLCFILFYMVLYLYGFVLVWFCICVVLYLCGSYLYGFVFVWFVLVWFCICVGCTCMVLYLCGSYLCGSYLCGFVLVRVVLVWFVLVWVVLVWFVLVWFCICVVCTRMVLYLCGFVFIWFCICMVLYLYGLYLYGFILFFYCDHVAGVPAIQQGIADEAILTYYEM